ncbi:MAG TPA: hypothetical protein VFQ06_08140, partial [Nitrospira sp.]|nr:hypothetical protein [Nitrospira sp.]
GRDRFVDRLCDRGCRSGGVCWPQPGCIGALQQRLLPTDGKLRDLWPGLRPLPGDFVQRRHLRTRGKMRGIPGELWHLQNLPG